MRAAYLTSFGPPDVISVGELPDPVPGHTELLVRADAIAVNPVDALVRAGRVHTELPMPFVVGRDVAGVVEACGDGARTFAPGQRVWCNSLGHAGRQGPTAQYAVAPADRVYPLPDGVDPAAAIAVAHPAATAWLALVRHARVRPGDHVLVHGAAGNVGRALVELAHECGAVVTGTARPDDLDTIAALGATHTVSYREPRLADVLPAHVPGGYDVVVDTAGRNDLASTVPLLAPRGRVVLLATAGGEPASLPVRDLYTRDGRVLGFAISNTSVADLAAAAAWINHRLTAGGLRPGTVEELPVGAAAEAHRRIESGLRGRIVLRP